MLVVLFAKIAFLPESTKEKSPIFYRECPKYAFVEKERTGIYLVFVKILRQRVFKNDLLLTEKRKAVNLNNIYSYLYTAF